jgi:nucleoside-diphosphate-sugar epimerase
MRSRILVAGAGGFIGGHLVKYIFTGEHDADVMHNSPASI